METLEYLIAVQAARTQVTPSKVLLEYPDHVMQTCGRSGRRDVFEYLWACLAPCTEEEALSTQLLDTLLGACYGGHLDLVQFLADQCYADTSKRRYFRDRPHSALTAACEAGHLAVVQFLVDRGVPLRPDTYEGAALVSAARSENLELIQFLIDNGATVHESSNKQGGESTFPLIAACEQGSIEIVKFFVEQYGADPLQHTETTCLSFGHSSLTMACVGGHLDLVRYFVTERCVAVRAEGRNGVALVFAAQSGNTELVQFLMDEGAVVDEMGPSDQIHWRHETTALLTACDAGHIGVIRLLVERYSADVSLRVENMCRTHSALSMACLRGHLDIVRFLVTEQHVSVRPKERRGEALVNAACSSNVELIRFLIDVCGARVDEGYSKYEIYGPKEPPIVWACESGQLEVVRLLITHYGASLRTWGITALCAACKHGHLDVVQALVDDYGCCPLTPDSEGFLPIHRACACSIYHHINDSAVEMVRYLATTHKVPLDTKTPCGHTPLALACRADWLYSDLFYSNLCLIRCLVLELEADTTWVGENGESLLLATLYDKCLLGGQRRVMPELVKFMATQCPGDVERADRSGLTPLKAVIQTGNLDLFQFFVDECKVGMVAVGTKQPTTTLCDALHCACSYGHLPLVTALINKFDADVDACNANGDRATYAAASGERDSCLGEHRCLSLICHVKSCRAAS